MTTTTTRTRTATNEEETRRNMRGGGRRCITVHGKVTSTTMIRMAITT